MHRNHGVIKKAKCWGNVSSVKLQESSWCAWKLFRNALENRSKCHQHNSTPWCMYNLCLQYWTCAECSICANHRDSTCSIFMSSPHVTLRCKQRILRTDVLRRSNKFIHSTYYSQYYVLTEIPFIKYLLKQYSCRYSDWNNCTVWTLTASALLLATAHYWGNTNPWLN